MARVPGRLVGERSALYRDEMSGAQATNVLLIEDDFVDIKAVRRAFQKFQFSAQLHCVSNGLQALETLRGTPDGVPLPRPYLILMDLNLPGMNGLKFLTELRGDPVLRDAIVFVLTTSSDETDISAAYRAGISGYFVKSNLSADLGELVTLLRVYADCARFP